MIGDIILFLKVLYTQTMCIHDYKPDRFGIILGGHSNRICCKCLKREIT